VHVLEGNLHAAGVGLNLTAATDVVFNDLDWVPGNQWHGEDRIYRVGQHRPAFVQEVVQEALRGEHPALARRDPARGTSARSGGLLEETLDLLVRAQRGLASASSGQRALRIASKSRPGEFGPCRSRTGLPAVTAKDSPTAATAPTRRR
jgi:SWI/SNF-related matrix-associated actin-dependent regulator 1 of chromatin subfamily A